MGLCEALLIARDSGGWHFSPGTVAQRQLSSNALKITRVRSTLFLKWYKARPSKRPSESF